MSSDDEPTRPPQSKIYDAFEEQERLTLGLLAHPDPTVRLVAHMSQRQLTLTEHVAALSEKIDKALKKFEEQQEDLEGHETRLQQVEMELGVG